MIEEVWKDVVGYESKFEISNFARFKNKKTGRILKQCTSKNGYKVVSTRPNGKYGKYKLFRIHRVVAEAFLPEPDEITKLKCQNEHWGKVIVRHIDHDKSNNLPSNLEWGTCQDNTDDSIRDGKFRKTVKGADNPFAKFTIDDIKFIRNNYTPKSKEFGCRALSRKYSVAHTTILAIINKQSYTECE